MPHVVSSDKDFNEKQKESHEGDWVLSGSIDAYVNEEMDLSHETLDNPAICHHIHGEPKKLERSSLVVAVC